MINITHLIAVNNLTAVKNKTAVFGQRPRPWHSRFTRTENFPLGNGRCTYDFVNVSLLERLRNGRFNFETAVRWVKN